MTRTETIEFMNANGLPPGLARSDPLTQAEVDQLPDQSIVEILWSGVSIACLYDFRNNVADGPHVLLHRTREPIRYPVRFVGPCRPFTVVSVLRQVPVPPRPPRRWLTLLPATGEPRLFPIGEPR